MNLRAASGAARDLAKVTLGAVEFYALGAVLYGVVYYGAAVATAGLWCWQGAQRARARAEIKLQTLRVEWHRTV